MEEVRLCLLLAGCTMLSTCAEGDRSLNCQRGQNARKTVALENANCNHSLRKGCHSSILDAAMQDPNPNRRKRKDFIGVLTP